MKYTESAGGVVVNSKGQVLVVNQNNDSWSLPKGHLEAGESALEAARREIAEESGIRRLTLIETLGTYRRHKIARGGGDDASEIKVIHMYLFTTDEEKLCPTDLHHPEARWVDKEKTAALLTHPKDKDFFRGIIDKIR